MGKQNFPIYHIDQLDANKSANGLLNADVFSKYMQRNPHLHSVHRHSFYHLLYFTEGSGQHTVDFVKFPVKKGMIYFMKPGQTHSWEFTGDVEGFIVNFSPTFFDQIFLSTHILEQFSFFGYDVQKQVLVIDKKHQAQIEQILAEIVQEQSGKKQHHQLIIASLLLQLFLHVSRSAHDKKEHSSPTYHSLLVSNFEKLIEEHYKTLKLPKEYASLLYITPNHLNEVCKDTTGLPAGEIIRNRIVLEAKRLLINFELSIGQIAEELGFKDNSYFVKFFKKYTALTPEQFRKGNK